MEAKDLRIGNFVRNKITKKEFRVVIIDVTETRTQTNSEPIPLDEGWLKRFGFEKVVSGDCYWFEYDFKENRLEFLSNDIGPDGFSDTLKLVFLQDVEGHVFVEEIKFVHQLQNLFYAISGKELKAE